MKRLVIVLGALALVIGAGLFGGSVLERNRKIGEIQALRAQLDAARFTADSCRTALSLEEHSFQLFNQRVDSLRNVVDGFEDPDLGGVPEAQYGEYLESFDSYNESVETWQIRADFLRANDAACRALVQAHNALGDSLRRIRDEINVGG
ncbi:hypothetical protein ACFL3S_12085 [Gemmatimonadota bacterium]